MRRPEHGERTGHIFISASNYIILPLSMSPSGRGEVDERENFMEKETYRNDHIGNGVGSALR